MRPSKLLLPILFGFLLLSSEISAQWTTYTAMPGTRWAHVCAAANGRLYVAGGSTGPTWEYDPATNLWAVRASIPTQRSYPAIASWGGMIYVMGGSIGATWSNLNERYDPATNTWTTMANMPQVRTTTAAAAVNGRIYVMNGWNGTAMTAVDIYDIASNTWSTGAPAPTGRSHAKTAVVNNRIYLVGGYAGGWTGINEVYDPGTNTWQTLAPMPTARYIHAVGGMGNLVYVAGGYAGSSSNVFESYDPISNTWTTEASMTTARYRTDGAAVNGCFYVLGGYNGSNLSTNEGFCRVILPIALELEGWKSGESVALQWFDGNVGEAESYVVERAGLDGDFAELGWMAAGTEKDGHFQMIDHSPSSGKSFYRLGRLDKNGNIHYSAAIEIDFAGRGDIELGWSSTMSKMVLRWGQGELLGDVQLDIFDLKGQQVERISFVAEEGGELREEILLDGIVKGVYLIRVRSESGQTTFRRYLGK